MRSHEAGALHAEGYGGPPLYLPFPDDVMALLPQLWPETVQRDEQGRLTVADLHERMEQPWFDAAGFLLVEDDATGEVVAFHWTKIEPGSRAGEVYVVGVDPGYQGRGLGGPPRGEEPQGAPVGGVDQLADLVELGLHQTIAAGRREVAGDVQDGLLAVVER